MIHSLDKISAGLKVPKVHVQDGKHTGRNKSKESKGARPSATPTHKDAAATSRSKIPHTTELLNFSQYENITNNIQGMNLACLSVISYHAPPWLFIVTLNQN